MSLLSSDALNETRRLLEYTRVRDDYIKVQAVALAAIAEALTRIADTMQDMEAKGR
jgi:hypothetical protein